MLTNEIFGWSALTPSGPLGEVQPNSFVMVTWPEHCLRCLFSFPACTRTWSAHKIRCLIYLLISVKQCHFVHFSGRSCIKIISNPVSIFFSNSLFNLLPLPLVRLWCNLTVKKLDERADAATVPFLFAVLFHS